MGLNVLGARQTRAVIRATGLPVVWAVVQSSGDAGRHVWFTTVTHRHGVLDRRTGEWTYGDELCRQWSCRVLFTDTADPDVIRERAAELRTRRATQLTVTPLSAWYG